MNRSRMLQGYLSAYQDPAFTMLVKTDNAGTSTNTQFTIPTNGTGYDYNVDWGDGLSDSNVNGDITHTYTSAGTYTVKITGVFPTIYFNDSGDKDKILEVPNLGSVGWQTFRLSFFGCSNLTFFSGQNTDTSQVTDLSFMFRECLLLSSVDVSGFDTSQITEMVQVFYECPSITSVDLSSWNTSQVTTIREMFRNSRFITSIDVSGWDTSNITYMADVFHDCESLETIDLSSFNTSQVTTMAAMFYDCRALTFDPSNFVITSVANLSNFATFTNMGTTNYDNLLVNWESQLVNNNLSPNFGNAQYTAGSAAATARQALIDDHSWVITDGGSV